MSVQCCKCCGLAYEEDELVDGTCSLCMECFDPNPKPLDFDNLYSNIDQTGDCV